MLRADRFQSRVQWEEARPSGSQAKPVDRKHNSSMCIIDVQYIAGIIVMDNLHASDEPSCMQVLHTA